MMRTFLALWVMASSFAFAAPKVFDYRLEGYRKSPVGCHAAAREAGDVFARATGLVVKIARCLNDTVDGYDFSIRYESEAPVQPVTTNPRLSAYPTGNFKSYKDCEAALPSLVDTFKKETTLDPAFSYCQRVSTYATYSWLARIEAFGEAANAPHMSGFNLFGLPVGMTVTDLFQQIRDALNRRDINVTHIVGQSSSGYAQVSVHYYAGERAIFTTEYLSKSTQSECLSELPALNSAVALSRGGTMAAFCGTNSINQVEATLLFFGEQDIEAALSAETYKTFNECVAARPALVDFYRDELRFPVIGGICTQARTGYRVNMISTKP